MVREEIEKEMKNFLEFNKNEGTIYSNILDTMKTLLKGKLIHLSASLKKLERSYTSSLTAYLKALGQRKQTHPKGIEGRKQMQR